MKIRKFEADTLREAMEQARRELGDNAVILNTREVRPLPGARGAGRPRVELVAAVDTGPAVLTGPEPSPSRPSPADRGPEPSDAVAAEVAALREALVSLVGEGVLAAHTKAAPGPERRLRDAGVEAALAAQIARSLPECSSPEEAAAQWECLFSCAPLPLPESGTAVWALTGPTGAGKTSCAARLAAACRFREKRSVALVSCDGARIGAAEQLERIASTMGIPFELCLDASSLGGALDRFASEDIVLVDTPGGSPADAEYLRGLRSLLGDGRICSLLVLPANLSRESRRVALEAFGAVDPRRVILTKLDEAGSNIPLLAICQEIPAAVSFLSEGQALAGGLVPADARSLALRVMEDLMS